MTSISETLASITEAESEDVAFIIAGAINLHSVALRRRAGRTIWTSHDVKDFLAVVNILLNPTSQASAHEFRPPKPAPTTDVELDAFEAALQSEVDTVNKQNGRKL